RRQQAPRQIVQRERPRRSLIPALGDRQENVWRGREVFDGMRAAGGTLMRKVAVRRRYIRMRLREARAEAAARALACVGAQVAIVLAAGLSLGVAGLIGWHQVAAYEAALRQCAGV